MLSPLSIKYVIRQCGFVTLILVLLIKDTKKKSKICCDMKTNSNYYTSRIKDLAKKSQALDYYVMFCQRVILIFPKK